MITTTPTRFFPSYLIFSGGGSCVKYHEDANNYATVTRHVFVWPAMILQSCELVLSQTLPQLLPLQQQQQKTKCSAQRTCTRRSLWNTSRTGADGRISRDA